jgi:hypothetical protein
VSLDRELEGLPNQYQNWLNPAESDEKNIRCFSNSVSIMNWVPTETGCLRQFPSLEGSLGTNI